MALYNAASTSNFREYANAALFNVSLNQTVAFWVHPNGTPSAQWVFVGRGTGTISGSWTCGTPSATTFNLARGSITNGSGLQTIADTVGWANNNWFHFAQTYNSTTDLLTIYVNGVLRNSSNPAGTFTQTSTENVRLFMRPGATQPADAYVERLGWWRSDFSAAEIDYLARGGDFTKVRRDDAIILDKLDSIGGVDLVSGLGTNTGTLTVQEPCPIFRPHLGQFWTKGTPNTGSGRTRRTYLKGVVTAPTTILGWGPELPDLAPAAAPRSNVGPSTAYVPAVNRWGLDAIPWLPNYPERVRAAPEPNRGPATAYSPAIDRWGIDGGKMPWHVVFPDRVPAAARPNIGPAFSAGQAIHGVEGAKGWDAEFPDTVPAARRPNMGPAFAAGQAIHGVEGGGKGWGATYPDRAPPPPRPNDGPAYASGQARFGVEGGLTGWLGVYPDFPARRAPSPIEFPAVAYVPAISRWGLDTLAWLPVFPATVRGLPRPVDVGLAALVALVAPSITLGWYPAFPDSAPGRPPPREYPQASYVPAVGRWGLDGTPWLPIYPDRVLGAARPNAGPFFAAPTSPPALPSWWPAYPDFARGRQRSAEYQALFFTALNFIAPPAPLGSWYPAFPDFARAAAPRLEGGPAYAPQNIVPLGSWYPSFPPAVRAAARAHNVDPGQLLRTLAALVNVDAWAPNYPDRIWAPRAPVYTDPAFVNLGAATPPPRGVGATFPDRLQPARRPTEGGATVPPDPTPRPLSWLGSFPVSARGESPRQQGATVVPPDPSPRALSWAPSFADRIFGQRPAPVPGQVVLVQLTGPPPAPLLAWLSMFPDMVRGPVPRHLLAQIIGAAPFIQGAPFFQFIYGPPSIAQLAPSLSAPAVATSRTIPETSDSETDPAVEKSRTIVILSSS